MIQLSGAADSVQMKKNENHLIIFCKYPQPGKVKTRLARDIGEKKALELYKLIVTNILSKIVYEDYDISIFFTPANKSHHVQEWINIKDIKFFPQSGKNLGNKMLNAFETSQSIGYKKAVIIGTDCLEINASIITDAFNHLDSHDMVLGPATDGGYYLIGLNNMIEQLFQGIEWGTDKVLKNTLNTARVLNIKYKLLDFQSDIDNSKDLINYKYLLT